jgi:biopolymer transport protein ExbD
MARKREEEAPIELNLTPIMNLVMILIPALVLSAVFMTAGVINISSPRNAQSSTAETEQTEEQVQIPKLVVFIGADGFRIGNMNAQLAAAAFDEFTRPIDGCAGAGATGSVTDPSDLANRAPTICNLTGVPDTAPLLERLDYAALYNHLVRIRMKPEWFDEFGKENNAVISLVGDPEVPFDTLVKVMDTARFMLNPAGGELQAPTAASSVTDYLLGGGTSPTMEQLENASFLRIEGRFIDLFPNPVLMSIRAQG